jgi:hypothetical protein
MMATAVFEPRESRLDRYFFPGLALLMLATVFLGFARSYFLAGVFAAPLPNWLIHLHGAAFTSWILLLITQTSLVATNRVDMHRKLGLAGFALACLMIVLGILASTDSLRRSFGADATAAGALDPKTFYIIPLTDMLVFGTLIFLAFRARCNPAAHKRLILVATTALTLAAVARWPIPFIQHRPLWVAELCTYGFLALLLAYDVYSTGKVHRVTIWASAFLIVVHRVRLPLGETAAWHAFATWAQNLARTIHG